MKLSSMFSLTKADECLKQKDESVPIMERSNDHVGWHKVEWLMFRTKVFERDGYTCQKCGKKDVPIQGHHLCYIRGRRVWEYLPSFVVTLCNDCHNKHHAENGIRTFLDESSAIKAIQSDPLYRPAIAFDREDSVIDRLAEKNEADATAPTVAPAPEATLLPVSAVTTDSPRKRRRATSSHVTCSAIITKDEYNEIATLAEKLDVRLNNIIRPFVLLIKGFAPEISASCKSELDIVRLIESRLSFYSTLS